jgi:hypothetical protein
MKKHEQRLGALLEPRVLEPEQQVDGVAAGHGLTPSSLQARETMVCICDRKKRARSGSSTPWQEATEASASRRVTL